ncbi:hypothetical protein GCM10029964_002610 [Kibdelosporangium lantanae]
MTTATAFVHNGHNRPFGRLCGVQLVTIDDIKAAADRVRDVAVHTPLVPAAGWADPERPLWIKPENLQPIGAFKIRGAYNTLARLDEPVRARGVVAYSSGNHAQAVAYAAAAFGVPAHIVMPEETPRSRSTRPARVAPRWSSAAPASARSSPPRWWNGPAACSCRRSTTRT